MAFACLVFVFLAFDGLIELAAGMSPAALADDSRLPTNGGITFEIPA